MGVWIHSCPTVGDEVVLTTSVIARWASVFYFPLLVTALADWPWSQQVGISLRPWSWVCTWYTHLIRAPRLFSLMTRVYTLTNSIVLLLWLYCIYCHLMDIVFISCFYIRHVILLFPYFSFVYLLGHIWDLGFACPDIDSMVAPSEEDQEYFVSVAEQQQDCSWHFVFFWLAVCSIAVLFLCYRYIVVHYIFINVLTDSYVLVFWYCSILCYWLVYNSALLYRIFLLIYE